MYNILFIHSVGGHFHCFHLEDITKNTGTMNICKVSDRYMFLFSLSIHLRVELLSHMETLCLIFWRIAFQNDSTILQLLCLFLSYLRNLGWLHIQPLIHPFITYLLSTVLDIEYKIFKCIFP